MTATTAAAASTTEAQSTVHLPKVEIKFCVQCKWNLRAAYYAQELLQTFSLTLGETSLVPVTGGIFTVTLYHLNVAVEPSSSNSETSNHEHSDDQKVTQTQVWDRKLDGGFPETKELKNRIRNLIDPSRDMGHIDRSLKKKQHGDDDKTDGGDREVSEKEKEKEKERKGDEQDGKVEDGASGYTNTRSSGLTVPTTTNESTNTGIEKEDENITTATTTNEDSNHAPVSSDSITASDVGTHAHSHGVEGQSMVDSTKDGGGRARPDDCEECRLAAEEEGRELR